MKYLICFLFALGQFTAIGLAEEVDITPLKLREKLLADAQQLLDKRGKEFTLSANLSNPFADKAGMQTADEPSSPVRGEDALSVSQQKPLDLLIKAANKIPATGTVNFAGQFFLLAGQKKYKSGDRLVLDMDGEAYELVISGINATSFTLQKGEYTHTRAVRLPKNLSSSSTRP